jgi:hypothetical protein
MEVSLLQFANGSTIALIPRRHPQIFGAFYVLTINTYSVVAVHPVVGACSYHRRASTKEIAHCGHCTLLGGWACINGFFEDSPPVGADEVELLGWVALKALQLAELEDPVRFREITGEDIREPGELVADLVEELLARQVA